MTNQTGAITYARTYNPYGVVAQTSGASQTAYGYTGEFTSNDMVYQRARYYAPGMGRFLTRDTYPYNFSNPVELNRYGYTGNDPINLFDPTRPYGSVDYALSEIGKIEKNIRAK